MCLVIPFLLIIPGFCGLCALILQRYSFAPLEIPRDHALLRKREFWLSFFAFFCAGSMGFGQVFLLLFYPVVVYRHLRDKRTSLVKGERLEMPRIPAMSLQDLMVMVFSLGALPLVMEGVGMMHNTPTTRDQAAFYMLYAGLIFPLCFVCALYRLEVNRVPLGIVRLAYLFLYPYAMFACLVLGFLMPFGLMTAIGRGNVFWAVLFIPAGTVAIMFIVSRAAASASCVARSQSLNSL
jgi:hypothetical protein